MAASPEWRFDPLTGRQVLISPARGERPLRPGPSCPFCEGHESETPAELLAFRDSNSQSNGPGWRVRVVPNRYAAVRLDCSTEREKPGVGVAEVFLECPHHESHFRNLAPEHVALVLQSWRDRLRYWRTDGRLSFAQVFKNEGHDAGASVPHCHSQLIGLPFVPRRMEEELARAVTEGHCNFCEWIRSAKDCRVMESTSYVAICPPAPRFPGETWILPKTHAAAFEDLADTTELAGVLLDLLSRIDRTLDGPDFNLIVKSLPFHDTGVYHWRIEVLPRNTSTAGWEWGTSLLINTMFPEDAAKRLREAPRIS